MILLDTDVAIEYLKNNHLLVSKVTSLPEKYLSVISIAELYYGAFYSPTFVKPIEGLKAFLLGVHILTLDYKSCIYFGKIKSELRKKGKIIGDFDITIASIAMAHRFVLWTNNTKHYKNITGLRLENPLN